MAAFVPKRSLLTVWRAYLIAGSLIPALLISLIFRGAAWLIAEAVWLAVFLFLYVFYLPASFKGKSFSVESGSVCARGGVFWRYNHTLPIQSIQYVTVISGPLDRPLKVCSVVAVAPGGRLVLSGLSPQDGERLKNVLARAG